MIDYTRAMASSLGQPKTYLHLAYLATGGLLGLLYLVVPLAMLTAGIGQALALLCVPLLVVASGFIGKLRGIERWLANAMLGTAVTAPEATRSAATKPPRRAAGRVSDPIAWKAAWWLAVRALFGLVVLTNVFFGVTLVLISISGAVGGQPVGSWWGIMLVPVGLFLLLLSAGFANAFAGFYAEWAMPLLGPSASEELAIVRRRYDLAAGRNLLAEELHDSVGHAMTVVVLQAHAAVRTFETEPEDARQALIRIRELGRTTLDELDRMLAALRDVPQAEIDRPAPDDLERLFDLMRDMKLPLSASVSGALADVPDHLQRETYRIVREGCTNVLRHTGFAPTNVSVAVDERGVEVTVTNGPSGRGSAPRAAPRAATGGQGLRGMAARAEELGGTFEAGPTDEGGYRLRVFLPLRAAET